MVVNFQVSLEVIGKSYEGAEMTVIKICKGTCGKNRFYQNYPTIKITTAILSLCQS